MARPGGAAPGARPWQFRPAWRRVTDRLLRSLWLQATGALLVAYLVTVPVTVAVVQQEGQAAAADAAARAEAQLRSSVGRLRLAAARQDAELESYAETGDAAFLNSYRLARRDALSAMAAAAAGARGSSLADELPPVIAAADEWESWAAGLARSGPAATVDDAEAAMRDGDARLDRLDAAATRLEVLAGAAAARYGARADALHGVALAGDLLGPIVGNGVIVLLGSLLVGVALRPVSRLAAAATELARGRRLAVPYTGRPSEIGSLARAMMRWQRSEASRMAILEHSPVGLFTLGPDLRLVDVNPALREMFGVPPDDRTQVSFASFIPPDELGVALRLQRQLLASESGEPVRTELRCRRRDGSTFWAAATVAVVRRGDRSPSHYVCMIEDISERRERVERAARVQRDLLPDAAPELEGYDLAGVCRPIREMGGNFYDWERRGRDALTLTLGDVMGKDMPAALLMAIERSALRATATLPSVGEAVRSAAASTGRDLDRAGAFVTLFHSRLDLDTGVLTYVDAGHGLAMVVADGVARRLPGGAPPLGVFGDEPYRERSTRLAPGEALVVFSDGVLDVHPGLDRRLEDVGGLVGGATSAREMAERLATGPGPADDDVTVVVLRREG